MGLDVNEIRVEKGGDPQRVKESCRKRRKDPALVDALVEKDRTWRKAKFDLDNLRKEYNKINKEVGQVKSKDPAADISEYTKQLQRINLSEKELKETESQLLAEIESGLHEVGNLVHESVPDSADEKDNKVVSEWGAPKLIPMLGKPGFCHHHQILHMIGGYEARRGQRLAGHRGYFLTGVGALLNLALVNFGISFLTARNYTAIQPPFFMKKEAMMRTAQLSEFDQALYKLQTGKKGESSYLIATSQQPISALFMGETLQEKNLPIMYAGMSTCFRKEAGAHGKDAWGIFRVHQFQKIQQFVITTPEESWAMHQKMIAIAEEFYQALELPYHVVNIVSGQLNNAAAKKLDLEAWFPGYGEKGAYRELVSCSNCTDYQARALDIRCGVKNQKAGDKAKKGGKEEKKEKKGPKAKIEEESKEESREETKEQSKEEAKKQAKEETKAKEAGKETGKKPADQKRFVHMLNATLCATERTMCCILQNYQTPEGVVVPKVLRPFMGNLELLPYVRDLPKKDELGEKPE